MLFINMMKGKVLNVSVFINMMKGKGVFINMMKGKGVKCYSIYKHDERKRC